LFRIGVHRRLSAIDPTLAIYARSDRDFPGISRLGGAPHEFFERLVRIRNGERRVVFSCRVASGAGIFPYGSMNLGHGSSEKIFSRSALSGK
jgi:hypothetical protein